MGSSSLPVSLEGESVPLTSPGPTFLTGKDSVKNPIRAPQYLPLALAAALGLTALTFSRVVYDLVTGEHDKLFAACAVISALALVGAVLTGMAIWRVRSQRG
jgi:hypothetical protein